MYNNYGLIFLIIFLLFSKAFADECETKYSAILLDQNDKIIYENRANRLVYPASLTKIMTLYLVFEALEDKKLRLSDKILVSKYASDISNINRITTLKLKEGDYISVRDAIYATAVKSMNGAAVALAEKLGGDEWNFSKMMNEKAEELKMFHTNFRNSTGLHEDGQYSTVYDLARLLAETQKDFPSYMNIFKKKEIKYNGKKFVTHNHFLDEYEGATGFKTGFTSIAGFNLMATAKRGGVKLSGVVTSCETHEARDGFMKEVFDYGYEVVGSHELDGELRVGL